MTDKVVYFLLDNTYLYKIYVYFSHQSVAGTPQSFLINATTLSPIIIAGAAVFPEVTLKFKEKYHME